MGPYSGTGWASRGLLTSTRATHVSDGTVLCFSCHTRQYYSCTHVNITHATHGDTREYYLCHTREYYSCHTREYYSCTLMSITHGTLVSITHGTLVSLFMPRT